MNETPEFHKSNMFFDVFALALIRLFEQSSIDKNQPLVRLANKQIFDTTPWIFDASKGVLHTRGCKAIPDASVSALYGIHSLERVDRKTVKCERCRDMSPAQKEAGAASDLLFGVMALVEQFSVVLRERGNEFRKTPRGKQLEKGLSGVIGKIDSQKNGGAQVVLEIMNSVEIAMQKLSEVSQPQQPNATVKKMQKEKTKPKTVKKPQDSNRSQGSKGKK